MLSGLSNRHPSILPGQWHRTQIGVVSMVVLGVVAWWQNKFKKIATSPFGDSGSEKIVSMLLSASVERFFVSGMWDLFYIFSSSYFL